MKVSVIGAGPVGGFAASQLVQQGADVALYEDNAHVGVPVQCTGLLSSSIKDLVKIKKSYLVNTIKQARIVAPNNTSVDFPIDDIVVDRTKFDSHFVYDAVDKGAMLHTSHRFKGIKDGKLHINDKHIGSDVTIGSDGPNSQTAQSLGIFGKRKFFFTKQATVKGEFDKDAFVVYLGSIAPQFFGWVVPENEEYARIGIGAYSDIRTIFDRFAKRLEIKEKSMVAYQGGLIPVYDPKLSVSVTHRSMKGYLLGDAATQVKATTGGGLIPGMNAAKALCDSIINDKKYETELKQVNRKLWLHLKLRLALDKFSDKEYNNLNKVLNKESVKNVFRTYSRDEPIQLATQLLMKAPGLLRYGLKLL